MIFSEKISKQIQLLLFSLLIPISLMGAQARVDKDSWNVVDKKGDKISLEWVNISDRQSFLDWYRKLAPVISEAFADETKDFLLDENLEIKQEYVEVIKKLSHSSQKELAGLIHASHLSSHERVAYVQERLLQMIRKAEESQEPFSNTCFIVLAKNASQDTLGFAIFQQDSGLEKEHAFELYLLAIRPDAQGRGLARPLIFAILTLVPPTKYIILCTKSWNARAQEVYKKLGFTVCSAKCGNISFKYEVKGY